MSSSLIASPPLSPTSSLSSPAHSPAQYKTPNHHSRRLLVPSFHVPHHAHLILPHSPRKSTSGKLSRPRNGSGASIEPHSLPKQSRIQWPFTEFKLQILHKEITLSGYRLYAVEKWIVQRARTSILIVYTGDQNDKITVAAVTPHPSLSSEEQARDWDNLASGLRREGARPRQTEHGIILVTSLASFRSDYTVVHIPGGDFLEHREQLLANINLLRIGCSGRSALTLNSPSDTTKDRFVNMYYFKDNVRSPELFVPTVLELGRVIQCSLSFFGCYSPSSEDQDGLLCDTTVSGIEQWVDNVCWPYAKIEPMERIADPSIVAALLSLVLTVRNKLSAAGFSQIHKDPFVHPRQFMCTISTFTHQRANQLRVQESTGSSSTSPPQPTSTSPNSFSEPSSPVLTDVLLRRIDIVYEKVRSTESYKVHRVLRNKLDDITSATTSAFASSSGRGRSGREHAPSLSLTSLASAVTGGSVDGVMEVTADLASFVLKVGLLRGRDGAPSLRYLWAGRLDQLERMRYEAALSDVEKERDDLRERSGERSDGRSSDEEGVGALPWSGRVHRKLEGWKEYAKTKGKRSSVDVSKDKGSQMIDRSMQAGLPSVVISRDPDELASPSSGQVSPISPSGSMIALGGNSPLASTTAIDDAEFFRRLQYFNQKYPLPPYRPFMQAARARARARAGSHKGLVCWSDPVSMEELVPGANASEGVVGGNYPYGIGYGYAMMSGHGYGTGDETARQQEFPRGRHGARGRDMSTDESEQEDIWGSRKRARTRYEFASRLKRWSSFDDHVLRNPSDCLSPDQMQIDVDLCAQCLIMRRRRFHVDAIAKTLQAVLEAAATSNELLKSEFEANKAAIHAIDARCAQLTADIDRARYETDAITLETNALRYEAGGYDVPELWQMARVPRHRVFAIRERVFGRGAAPSTSGQISDLARKKGAHGRFNRVQRTLDRRDRYVDWLGRTESEVDEESELPEVIPVLIEAGASSTSLAESETASVSTPGVGAGSGAQGYVGGYASLGALPKTISEGGGGWLLTMFSKWGSILGAGVGAGKAGSGNVGLDTSTGSSKDGDGGMALKPNVEMTEGKQDEPPETREDNDSNAPSHPPPSHPPPTAHSISSNSSGTDKEVNGTTTAAKWLDTISEESSSDFLHRSSASTLTSTPS